MSSPQGFGFYGPGTGPAAAQRTTRPQITTRSAELRGGRLFARVGRPGAGAVWSLRRITVTGPAGSRCSVYIGDPADLASFVDGTRSGAGDVAEYVVPVLVLDQADLQLVWTSADGAPLPAGATATARVEYDETS